MFWSHRSRFGHKSSITCLFVVNTVCSEFAPRQKRMFWGHTLKERGIVIFAWFLGSVFGLFHKSVCFEVIGLVFASRQKRMSLGSVFGLFHKSVCLGVIGLVFAPRQERMFWRHTLKERGIVIFAWSQCFVCFERPSCFGHTHSCIGYVLCPLFSLFAVNECNFRIDMSIVRIVHTIIIQSFGSNESTTLL